MGSKTVSKKRVSINKKTLKRNNNKKIYSSKDFNSGDGMLTSVWGPSLWHYLHVLSFNYPVKPTKHEKQKYREFILNLQYTLPCRYCRDNLKKNLKQLPLNANALKNRDNFSRWVYDLHELINKMLGKKSGLTYKQIRERYEHFRSRCTLDKKDVPISKPKNKTRKKEKGCTKPLYGKKSKCIIKIVPQETRCKTFQMDKKCVKKR